jgi:hypothetical protein
MSLAPIRSVPMPEMKQWVDHFKPIMCTFTPRIQGVVDVQANASNLKTLVGLLASKGLVSSSYHLAFYPNSNTKLWHSFSIYLSIPI